MDTEIINVIRKSMQDIVELDNTKYYEAFNKLTDRFISLKCTGVSSRIFLHWKERGLIDYPSDSKRVKLNIFEFIWIKCLQKMRDFGLSLKMIKDVKESVGVDVLDWYKEMRKEGNKDIDEAFEYYEKDANKRKEYFKQIDNEKLIDELKKTEISFTLFNVAILKCLLQKERVNIYIYEDIGSFMLLDSSIDFVRKKRGDDVLMDIDELESAPHFKLNLNYFISEYLDDAERTKYLSEKKILSQQELMVLKLLKDKEIKQIKITKEYSDSVYKLSTTTFKNPTPEQSENIKKALNLENYESINITTNSQDKIQISRTKKNHI